MENNKIANNNKSEISDILLLTECMPIDNGRLKKGINAKVPLKDDIVKGLDEQIIKELFGQDKKEISFRDIVRLLIKFLKGADVKEAKIALGGRLEELRKIGCTYPAQIWMFDFCLAALEGDHLDAKLYLAHGFQILGLSEQLNLLLSAIVYTPLTDDEEVRRLLTLLAAITQPADIQSYLELYGDDFTKRYEIYQNELMRLK